MELGEHLGEGRDHQQVDHRQRHAHGDQHEQRVAGGLLDALARLALHLQVAGQLAEGLVELAGVLADADHADEQRVEHPGMVAQRRGHGRATFEIAAQGLQHLAKIRVARRLGEAADGADDRYAGLAQAVHLPAEDDQLLQLDALAAEQLVQLAQDVLVSRSLLSLSVDAQRDDALGQQLAGQCLGARRLAAAADLAALGIAPAETEARHQPIRSSLRLALTLSTSSTLVSPARAKSSAPAASGR
ncbi:hypothetical protein D3C80_1242530 [compost metagenome]